MNRPLRVAVIGSGPAGVYASDALMKSSTDVEVDLFEKMPAPFGLIRYGVAPDHPRIKGIIMALHRVMEKPELRLFSNVEFGKDITLDELKEHYDAVIFATGAVGDRALPTPGADLPEHFGAGEFVGFYDGNPLFERTWDLSAESVAVVGVGNVALDVSRILAKTGEELHVTEIPDNVYEVLKTNKAKEVHVFGRRGPAQAKFTPLELKELDYSPNVEVVVDPRDIDYDSASEIMRRNSKITDQVCTILENYAIREPKNAPHKLYIHFFESPVEILSEEGTDGQQHVTGLRTQRMEYDGAGGLRPTGETTDWKVGAVYSAVGYRSDALPGIPFDNVKNVISNVGGRVIESDNTEDEAAEAITGLYTTGWVRRGPVGLIGNTKGDANEAVANLLADAAEGKKFNPSKPELSAINELLESKGIDYLDWEGWHKLDAAERAAGEAEGRERKKYVEWDEMVTHSKGE
ncbi:pyridine nucleotide-disulfide oxidoreductase [Corynebacterium sp. HMSC055G02]|uniref:FAD-dependent oxidoreductase n=1 Tax=Corynebacterium TaxID=1716 RepID=UPI00084801A9|nr:MULTISPECIES: FAD-dependent oxidoreductase [Corynebacterium]KAA0885396.1 pyridine nucleotide-disulfide oxidoreductase [Corynebacterium amycolatum]KAA9225953.1 pyridine nucleotide-disulfide oxidoreductase [Corynebacterium amycolatum]MBC6793447.1 pyridine nucleotide-disulfide oxidoreductase [Corynebacterium sp. LK26]MBC6807484.1 pyridine nucleotide-disulfide oxidoreductase [Corynebacterium sp. LK30]MBC6829548.1 pyridine nucleotide-disulfide oxidoreductase [Corynebacterium sp. LK32]